MTKHSADCKMANNHRTAQEVIAQAYSEQPHLKLAVNEKQTVIGSWDNNLQRFVAVASLAITGEWVSMPFEMLINGKPMVAEWFPVAR